LYLSTKLHDIASQQTLAFLIVNNIALVIKRKINYTACTALSSGFRVTLPGVNQKERETEYIMRCADHTIRRP
jgi:hypothetical protein